MKKPIAQKKYLKNSFNCPVCRSTAIDGGDIEINGDEATQEISCYDCNSSWYDSYKLVSYTIIVNGTEKEKDKGPCSKHCNPNDPCEDCDRRK